MGTFFIILGVLSFVGLVAGLVLFVIDLPPRSHRERIEQTVAESAWRIHEHTKAAVEQMLDTAQKYRDGRK